MTLIHAADGSGLRADWVTLADFDSPLVGVIKSDRGYERWYSPSRGAGAWTLALRLPDEEAERYQ